MKYGFISRTLLVNETLKIASLYSASKNWDEVTKTVFEDNTLQKNKIVTLKKQFSEIKTRLQLLPEEILLYLNNTDLSTAKLILFMATAIKYRLLHELVFELLRDKYLTFNYTIFDHDYESFLRSKYENYPNLEQVKNETRIKLKSTIFKILEEAGLIDSKESKNIVKPFINNTLIELVVNYNPSLLLLFLFSEDEIKIYKEKYGVLLRKDENR